MDEAQAILDKANKRVEDALQAQNTVEVVEALEEIAGALEKVHNNAKELLKAEKTKLQRSSHVFNSLLNISSE